MAPNGTSESGAATGFGSAAAGLDSAAVIAPNAAEALEPVERPAPFAAKDDHPEDGIGLCLSGGGYRAMMFHVGVLWRLNELKLLHRIARISSVSGGSITAGLLGLRWSSLDWHGDVATNFIERVVAPIRRLASHTIDAGSIIAGALLPGVSISEKVLRAYRKHLYGDATLQDLPDESSGAPRFVINATNVQSGVLWRFSRPYMADYRVGRVDAPTTQLALAVAASSAFPPVLSPARMELEPGVVKPTDGADLHRPPFTTDVLLTDGGVYDNLGLETVWKRYRTVLVSDGGGQMEAEDDPETDWVRHGLRVNALIDSQVRALRKRQVVGSFERGVRKGSYWRMRGNILDYPASDKLPCPRERTMTLARTPTRLQKMDDALQERLINWGYAITDAAVRGYVEPGVHSPPVGFPYDAGV